MTSSRLDHLCGLLPNKSPVRLWPWDSHLFLEGVGHNSAHSTDAEAESRRNKHSLGPLGSQGPGDLSTARPSRTLTPGAPATAVPHPKPLRRHTARLPQTLGALSWEAHGGSSAQVNTQQSSPEQMSHGCPHGQSLPLPPPPPLRSRHWGSSFIQQILFL